MNQREVAAFFDLHFGRLTGPHWLEVRCLPAPAEKRLGVKAGPRDWFQNPVNAAVFALLHCDRWEVFFGVNPRRNRGGHKEDVTRIDYLHADLDAYGEGGHRSKLAAMNAVFALEPRVTRIIDSGGGLHCYWQLAEPMPPTPVNIDLAESSMRSLYVELGAKDLTVRDISRILRVPGTINHKYGERVRIIHG